MDQKERSERSERSNGREELQLLERIRSRDARAMDLLLTQLQPSVYRFGLKMCRNDADAEDILQETLLAVSRGVDGFRGDSSLLTWAFTIARSFCIKKRRKSKFAPKQLESLHDSSNQNIQQIALAVDDHEAPDEKLALRQLERVLDSTLADLDVKYREVFVLRDIEGLSADEVSRVLGITVQAVKSRLHRARDMVRLRMNPLLPESLLAETNLVPCLDIVKRYSQFLEGEITGTLCDSMQKHVQECPGCRNACDSLKHVLAVCKDSAQRHNSVPVLVQERVKKALSGLK